MANSCCGHSILAAAMAAFRAIATGNLTRVQFLPLSLMREKSSQMQIILPDPSWSANAMASRGLYCRDQRITARILSVSHSRTAFNNRRRVRTWNHLPNTAFATDASLHFPGTSATMGLSVRLFGSSVRAQRPCAAQPGHQHPEIPCTASTDFRA
jgi:hypothetical protein